MLGRSVKPMAAMRHEPRRQQAHRRPQYVIIAILQYVHCVQKSVLLSLEHP